jgi:hypothetical protein
MTTNSAAILREAAYEEGYKAGKQEIIKQIFEDLVSLGGCSRGILLNSWDIAELKEKYGVK